MLLLVKASDGIANLKDIAEELESVTFSPGQDALQTLIKSDKARVFVDFHSFERSQAIHLQVEEILDGEVLHEAQDFADLISPVFRVVLQGARGGKVPDGQTVDLIVELEPSECGKGLLLRGRVATDSFSWWGVAKCHVKVAAHHVGVDTESGHR
jgi:hypothetical protein